MKYSKWLARLGGIGYDILIVINRSFNFISEKVFKRGKLSFSKKIKNSVKLAVSFINNFEKTCADIGIRNKFDYVICGHIHHPEIRMISNSQGNITYLNSGDWVESLSSLEYSHGEWTLYKHESQDKAETGFLFKEDPEEEENLTSSFLFNNLFQEFNNMKQ
jgi:UDP-2,3-diacylglucosamine pyrophosphatase LpxH